MEADVDESEAGIGELLKGGGAEIDDPTLTDQMKRGAPVGDPHGDRSSLVVDPDLGVKRIKPAGGGQLVRIERLSIGHRPAAKLLSVKTGITDALGSEPLRHGTRRRQGGR